MSETEAIRRQWAREQAADFGREALGFTGYDGYYDSDAAYEYARLAGHFGRIALGESEAEVTALRAANQTKQEMLDDAHTMMRKLDDELVAAESERDDLKARIERAEDAEQQLEVLKPGGTYAWKTKCEAAESERDAALKREFDLLVTITQEYVPQLAAVKSERDALRGELDAANFVRVAYMDSKFWEGKCGEYERRAKRAEQAKAAAEAKNQRLVAALREIKAVHYGTKEWDIARVALADPPSETGKETQ